ncbi:hypothetical protein RFI_19754, partial [Reticulomyxa filosa]
AKRMKTGKKIAPASALKSLLDTLYKFNNNKYSRHVLFNYGDEYCVQHNKEGIVWLPFGGNNETFFKAKKKNIFFFDVVSKCKTEFCSLVFFFFFFLQKDSEEMTPSLYNYEVVFYNYWNTWFETSPENNHSPVYQPLFWRYDIGSFVSAPQMLLNWTDGKELSSATNSKYNLSQKSSRNKKKVNSKKMDSKKDVVADLHFKFSNERKYLANAMYSLATGQGERSELQYLISMIVQKVEANIWDENKSIQIFTRYFSEWKGNNNEDGGYLNADQYKSVLLDSIFTICPFGNNPETFRLWEAIGHGSIPIIALDSSYFERYPCMDSFRPIFDFSQWYYGYNQTYPISHDEMSIHNRMLFSYDGPKMVDKIKMLIKKYQAMSKDVQTDQHMQELLIDEIELILKEDTNIFLPVVILRNWNELEDFFKKAIHIDWEWYQAHTLLWWHRFVKFKFDQMLHRLFESAPFCKTA